MKRAPKVYTITASQLPERNEAQKAHHPHLQTVAEAISSLVYEGISQATSGDIMQRAVELNLYGRRESTQNTLKIFSWWRKPLREAGFIA